MNQYLLLVLGAVFAGVGGELFVRGTVGLARWFRVSPGIIGVTVAAFSTSSPELTVAVSAALASSPQISLGDALGSNVVNVALILALALVISPVHVSRQSVKRDFPIALVVPAATAAILLDGTVSRLDGLLMLALFIGWLWVTVIEARKQRSAAAILGERSGGRAVVWCIVGLIFLVGAGRLIVTSATGIALSFGIDPFVIGATIVAVGTSVPELATTVIAKLRGHDEVALGTILGSNIFNGIFIVPIAAIIFPYSVALGEVAVALGFGFAVVLLTWPTRQGVVGRARGGLLLLIYGAYLAAVIHAGGSVG